MIDKRNELIEKQKDIIATYERVVMLQTEKEKVMQRLIDNLSMQLNLTHLLNDIK
jgi:hypothetical protein